MCKMQIKLQKLNNGLTSARKGRKGNDIKLK